MAEGRQFLDSLTLASGNLTVQDSLTQKLVSADFYYVSDNFIIWKKPPSAEVVLIKYQVFPFLLGQRKSHLDTARIRPTADGEAFFEYNPYESTPQRGLPDFKGLDYNGSFSRGISFGNNQNLAINSNFNLQLAGNVTDDIEISAALSDNNIPLQPDGNTQRLSDFGRVFIQLKKKQNTLLVGDYDLLRPPSSYFMNYNKKLQGLAFNTQIKLTKNSFLDTKSSVSISRGKSARNNIAQQEGNQGPYRLRGKNGEQFLIVLAGTEKVWLDGLLLRRGIDEDYTIDYNRADITFSNKRLITKDSRVIVEFEYNDLNYLRTLYTTGAEFRQGKLGLQFHLFSEQDSKNSSGGTTKNSRFDSLSQVSLRAAGTNTDNLFVSSIDTASFSPDRVLYRLADTLVSVNGRDSVYNILIYSTNSELTSYKASFLDVGQSKGNYIQVSSAANGRVFTWIAPNEATGLPQGNFEPVTKLTAPILQQLYTLGGNYQFSKKSVLKIETALSNISTNRLAEKSAKNAGTAFFIDYFNLSESQTSGWSLLTHANYEFTQALFKPLNVYRPAEFIRDWNIENDVTKVKENIAKIDFVLNKKSWGSLGYEAAGFWRDSSYRGVRQLVKLEINRKGLEIKGYLNVLDAKKSSELSRFLRPKLDINYTFSQLNGLKLGIYGEREKNNRMSSDTLQQNSFYYNVAKIYAQSAPSEKIEYGISYLQRTDYKPVTNYFIANAKADEISINGRWQQNKSSQLSWNMTYRTLQTDTNQQSNYLGRVDYSLNLWRGAVRWFNSYELGSGQEQKIDYQYIPVADGQLGVYQGIDRNGDGVLQQDEYEIAPTAALARYIRITVLTNNFVKTHNVTYNQTFSLDPRAMWGQSKSKWKQNFNKWSVQSTFRVTKRVLATSGAAAWNPFSEAQPDDPTLIAGSKAVRNTVFFNRNDAVYELQIGNSDNQNRQILSVGLESRQTTEQFFRSRWNVIKNVTNNIYVAVGERRNNSQAFANRDYTLRYFSAEPQVNWTLQKNLRFLLTYKYLESKNIAKNGDEKLRSDDFSVENTYNTAASTSLRSRFSFVRVAYEGRRNTPVEFALLDGLQNGKNFILNVTFDKKLANNIQVSVTYEGRKTGSASTLHTGRAQVRATF